MALIDAIMLITVIFITVTISALIIFLGTRQMNSFDTRQSLKLAIPIFAIFVVCAFFGLDNLIISNGIILLTATVAGSLIGRMLNHEVSIITFSVVASIMDFFSYSNGLTAAINTAASSDSMILRYLVIHIPFGSKVIGLVGIGDLYILGCIYFALRSLGYSERGSVLAPLGGILIALVIGITVGGIFGVPFIVCPAIIFLVYHSKKWRNQTVPETSSIIVQKEYESFESPSTQ